MPTDPESKMPDKMYEALRKPSDALVKMRDRSHRMHGHEPAPGEGIALALKQSSVDEITAAERQLADAVFAHANGIPSNITPEQATTQLTQAYGINMVNTIVSERVGDNVSPESLAKGLLNQCRTACREKPAQIAVMRDGPIPG